MEKKRKLFLEVLFYVTTSEVEAAWLSGQETGLQFQRSWVQVMLCLLQCSWSCFTGATTTTIALFA